MATSLNDTTPLHPEQHATNDSTVLSEAGVLEKDETAEGRDLVPTEEGSRTGVQEGEIGASVEEPPELGQEQDEPSQKDSITEIIDATTISRRPHASAEPDFSLETESIPPVEDEQTATIPDAVDEQARAPTPVSRTSTPPLPPGSTAPVKKFSSVNVNRQFLRKTIGPTSGTPAGATKTNSLTGRPAASPITIGSPSSRLLSSKLITVSSKNSTSPLPSGSAGATSSVAASPWAKPAVTPTSLVDPEESPIAHPAPTRGKALTGLAPPAPMGSGVGIGLGASKPAWRAVGNDGRRLGGNLGLTRDFPTANEVAEGKKQAQIAAQAQAAHNQAIIQGLNAFAQLDPNAHRWDDEDDDDDVIDFGDGSVYPQHEPLPETEPAAPVLPDIPVPKSERFAEDFDRSWPPRRPPPPATAVPAQKPSIALPKRPDDKVLFNASSNKLEIRNNVVKPPAPPQPTRVMTRPGPPAAGARSFERLAPPHLQGTNSENVEEGDGRMLPPHMAGRPRPVVDKTLEARSIAPVAPSSTVRQPWGSQRDVDRPLPPHLSERKELPPQSSAFASAQSPPQSTNNLPPRRSFSQAAQPVQSNPPPTASASQIAPPAIPNISSDPQTQEMHTAAEKARERRLVQEAEMEAAAERARRKLKELEEKLGLKETKPEIPAITPPVPAQPTFTLAQRPKLPPVDAEPVVNTVTPSKISALAGLPPRPPPEMRAESSWRGKTSTEPSQEVQMPKLDHRSSRPTAESYFEPGGQIQVNIPETPAQPSHVPVEEEKIVKKAPTFEDTMKRIQAALKASKAAPPEVTGAATLATALLPNTKPLPAIVRLPSTSPQIPAVSLQPAPAPVPTTITEYFNVTSLDPPKSPPPAWRTYTIKLPNQSNDRAFATTAPRPTPPAPPKTFLMTFNPPINALSTSTLSRADLLLAQTSQNRRFVRSSNEPWVSISPRQFEPYKRQKRRSAPEYPKQLDIDTPPAQLDILLPSPGIAASAQLRSQRVTKEDRWGSDSTPLTVASSRLPSNSFPSASVELPKKSRSPVKASQAVKAEKDERSFLDGPVGLPERGRMPSLDVKPGVRFMVNSELEGDSLLDEVNKMSLETVGEGYGDGDDEKKGVEGESKTPGSETPKTPPSLSGASSRGHPSSPVSNSTPWSKGSARSASQHDHIKSVWDQPESVPPTVSVPQPNPTSHPTHSANLDPGVPMYPSLNSPAPVESSTSKHPYTQSQPFSPTSSGSPFGYVQNARSSAHPSQYAYSASPEHSLQQTTPSNSMAALAYGGRTNGIASSAVHGINGYGGVWGNGGFGSSMTVPGYGYSPQNQGAKDGMGVKAGAYGIGSGAAEYRYGSAHPGPAQSPVSPYGGYSPHQAQSPHGQAPGSNSGFVGYQARSAQVPNQAYYGGINARVPTQQQSGRFGAANGDYTQQNGYESPSGAEYYGGIHQGAYGYGGQPQSAALGAIGQQGRGSALQPQGRKNWQ